MSLTYADEKFSRAIYLLATSPGGIHERLINACVSELDYVQVERDLPEELHEDFNLLKARLTSESAPVLGAGEVGRGEGRIHATVRAMSEGEAVEVARKILSLSYLLKHAVEVERPSTTHYASGIKQSHPVNSEQCSPVGGTHSDQKLS